MLKNTLILKGGTYNSFGVWSKDTHKSYISESWVVRFDYGDDGWYNHDVSSFIVCVRDF